MWYEKIKKCSKIIYIYFNFIHISKGKIVLTKHSTSDEAGDSEFNFSCHRICIRVGQISYPLNVGKGALWV